MTVNKKLIMAALLTSFVASAAQATNDKPPKWCVIFPKPMCR